MPLQSLPPLSPPADFRETARLFFIHLRLNFQILLAPIFLWGYYLAGGHPDLQFWVAFVSFHLFLYGGTTVYNSCYDHDEGPVGGLEHPPPVVAALLPLSVLWQGIGLALALWVNVSVGVIYGLIFALATAYSRPWPRLKGRPLAGLLAVAVGQGVLAAGGGWAVADPRFAALYPLGVAAILAAAAFTTGFYPLTQIYQVEEDLSRGDVTFAAWAGPSATFGFGLVTMSVAVAVLSVVFFRLFDLAQMMLLLLFSLGWLAIIGRWASTYKAGQVLANYRRVMHLYRLMTLGFLGFICLHLFNLWPFA